MQWEKVLFNVSAILINNSLDTTSESSAAVDDEVLGHVVPGTRDGGLQRVHIRVRGSVGLPLQFAPNSVVQGIQIRRLGRPHVGRPKVRKVGPAELLGLL